MAASKLLLLNKEPCEVLQTEPFPPFGHHRMMNLWTLLIKNCISVSDHSIVNSRQTGVSVIPNSMGHDMATPVHDPRGALWRVWDLHFHTPSSYDYSDMSVTNGQIVDTLVNAGVSVVAITDHHTIDIGRIENLRTIAGDKLVVLPGIEVRTELGGADSVHVIGVLPEDCNLSLAWDTIRVSHKLDQQIAERGDESVYVVFRDFAEDIHELGGLTIVHAGTKSNSIEEISNSTAFKQALKGDLAREASDIFEIANLSNIAAYHKIVFPAIGKELPLVLCSDAHGIAKYSPPRCWIKADPSFYGLSQVIHDPQDRVFLGDTPPAVVRVRENKSKYMSSVAFIKVVGSELAETWFDAVTVPLNPGLVAIIGNKGSGKSALSESLGLLGGCRQREDFSFLSHGRFLQGKKPKASHFEGCLKWEDGSAISLGLHQPNGQLEERVRYIPQNYLETVCNELKAGGDTEFTHQIEQVILSHVPLGERTGHETLTSLIEDWITEIVAGITHTRDKLRILNSEIAEVERQLLPEYRNSVEKSLAGKRKEVEILNEVRPAHVAKPAEDSSTSPEMMAKLEEAERHDAAFRDLEQQVRENTLAQQEVKRSIQSCEKLSQAVDNFSAHYEDLRSVWESEGAIAGLALADVVTYVVAKDVLEARSRELSEKLDALVRDVSPSTDGSLVWRMEATRAALVLIRAELSAPSQAYQKYLDEERAWAQKRSDLIGDSVTPGSVSWFEAQLEKIGNLPTHLDSLVGKRALLVADVFDGLIRWRKLLERAYGPVQQYIREHPLMSERAQFEFAASISDVGLTADFFEIIHKGRRGSFCREGESTLRRLIDSADFSSADGVMAFASDVIEHLNVDKRHETEEPVSIEDQLKEGVTRSDIYNLLFCLEYLEPTYSLRWAGKDLDLLSPGEKGALLLVFYLLIDKNTCPLLIDQPEENLDNQTVFKVLVPCINEARRRRQIVLVTHNPNLAVVCDADQVIAASLSADGSCALAYTCGAIENPVTSEAIVDVLEGTKPAFEKRDRKYAAALTDWFM